MKTNTLIEIITIILSISISTERIVTVAKTIWPEFLDNEKTTPSGQLDKVADKRRRISVQLIAFIGAWFLASFINKENKLNFFGDVYFLSENIKIPSFIIGILATGGSTFWSSILGIIKANKEIKNQHIVENRISTIEKNNIISLENDIKSDEVLSKIIAINSPTHIPS
ncbi:hypothetical protein [Siphonobacter sp. SORGH_AS_1065]|uniref:hypothetical protein n=1 Tax=Siphonobacter sp. SORGH_AS_1065 TaxID=3041795 RepID=UPI002787BDD4|nr:hypothetical protein [Siphonobacter sp. SORGH_AS_1065]MDQ1086176.1 hypothetical protein [Siphonobacter sp. SORGH_AS_1065]